MLNVRHLTGQSVFTYIQVALLLPDIHRVGVASAIRKKNICAFLLPSQDFLPLYGNLEQG